MIGPRTPRAQWFKIRMTDGKVKPHLVMFSDIDYVKPFGNLETDEFVLCLRNEQKHIIPATDVYALEEALGMAFTYNEVLEFDPDLLEDK